MKKIFPLLLLLSGFFLNGCLEDECRSTRTFVQLNPIFKSEAECRADLTVEAPHHVAAPSKIYAWKQYLLINERQEGILVLDNSNPESPQPLTFWRLPGNVDFTIRGNYLYADQYMDLISIDISNIMAPKVLCREENVFHLFGQAPGQGYIVSYERTNITQEIDCKDAQFSSVWFPGQNNILLVETTTFDAAVSNVAFASVNPQAAVDAAVAGIAGSYTRFAQHPDYLYIVDNSSLSTFNVQNPACPSLEQNQTVGWNIETIFPWKNWLFVGSNNAVYIFNNEQPQSPALIQTFTHATGCDPVICDDSHAYVTIRDGANCGGFINQLDVIDISTLPVATLAASYGMKNPRGLAQNETHLFVCDDGLKIFDKTKSPKLTQVAHYKNIDSYDALMIDGTHLIVIASNGVFQFDVADPSQPKMISSL